MEEQERTIKRNQNRIITKNEKKMGGRGGGGEKIGQKKRERAKKVYKKAERAGKE